MVRFGILFFLLIILSCGMQEFALMRGGGSGGGGGPVFSAPRGVLDTSFGVGGIVTYQPVGTDYPMSWDQNTTSPFFFVGRFSNGPFYHGSAFMSSSGVFSNPVSYMVGNGGVMNHVIYTSGGRYACGYADIGGQNDFLLARYTLAGALDTSFGAPNGYVTLDLSSGANDTCVAVRQQSDGKIVTVGPATSGGFASMGLARFTTTGVLDTSYNAPNGFRNEPNPIAANGAAGYGGMIDSSNRVYTVGIFDPGSRVAVSRYTSSGAVDTSFGAGLGYVFHNIGGTSKSTQAYWNHRVGFGCRALGTRDLDVAG